MEKINANVFLTVVETGSFRKAADVMGYTQAGISYIISAMEEETGLNLFIRERGGVRLSPEGQAILPRIKELESWERQFKQTVNEIKGLEKGIVRVQIFDSISIHWLPPIIKKFRDDYPGIEIELISEEDSIHAEEMVMTGEVDCGFFLTDVKSDIDSFPLITESLMACLSTEHPLAKRNTFPIAKLGDYPFISMKYDSHTGIENIFTANNAVPQIAYHLDNDYAAMAMISQGLGYSIFPELLLRDIPYEITCLEFDKPQKRTISIGTRSIKECSKACAKFIEYTRAWVKENY